MTRRLDDSHRAGVRPEHRSADQFHVDGRRRVAVTVGFDRLRSPVDVRCVGDVCVHRRRRAARVGSTLPERDETAGVVRVLVGEHHPGHVTQIGAGGRQRVHEIVRLSRETGVDQQQSRWRLDGDGVGGEFAVALSSGQGEIVDRVGEHRRSETRQTSERTVRGDAGESYR